MLYGYMADKDNYISRTNLQEGMKKHSDLLLRDFMLRDRDGQLLSGKLASLEPPTIPERGVLVDDLMQTKVVYHLVYPVAKPPDYLTFQQKIGGGGGAFLPSIMQLTVRQAGAEARPMVALTGEGDVQTFEFEWSGSRRGPALGRRDGGRRAPASPRPTWASRATAPSTPSSTSARPRFASRS